MFFKNNADIKAANNACWVTFIFLGSVLLINSFFELFFHKTFMKSSFLLLVLSLLVFFISDFLFSIKNKKARKN